MEGALRDDHTPARRDGLEWTTPPPRPCPAAPDVTALAAGSKIH